jgi:hypothetical protein
MSNITGNQDGNVFVLGEVAQAVGDYFRLIKRSDEAREEYLEASSAYDMIPRSSQELFNNAQNNKNIVGNLLDELSSKPPVAPAAPIKLIDLLQDKVAQAVEAGWQTLEDIFGTNYQPAFRSAVQRAKEIHLGAETVVFVIKINEVENQEVNVFMSVLPIREQTHLPKNLKVKIIPDSGEPDEHLAESHPTGFETEWFYERGERFSVQMQLDDVSVTENFVV